MSCKIQVGQRSLLIDLLWWIVAIPNEGAELKMQAQECNEW